MNISEEQIQALLKMLTLTKDEELNCDECLSSMAEFAENELAGKSVTEGLASIDAHLQLCGECREEYESLKSALQQGG